MVCQLEIIGRPFTKYVNGLPISSCLPPDALYKKRQILSPEGWRPRSDPLSEVLCTFELSHKCCDNSSSAEKDCLFQRNQIFETPSLTAEKVTAAREVEEQ